MLFHACSKRFHAFKMLFSGVCKDLMQEIAASTGRQWIMLVVAIINSAIAILLVAHVMTCFWYALGVAVEQMGEHPSWLQLALITNHTFLDQYLHSFRYVMDAPSPPVLHEASRLERFFDILITILCLVLIGSAISKISGTIVELRGMNEAKTKQRSEIRQYLHSQDASFELVSRAPRR